MDLIKLIENEMISIKNKEEIKYNEFFINTFSKYSNNSPSTIENISNGELFTLLIKIHLPQISFNEIDKIQKFIDKFFIENPTTDLTKFISYFKLAISKQYNSGLTSIVLTISKYNELVDFLNQYNESNSQLILDWLELLELKSYNNKINQKIKEENIEKDKINKYVKTQLDTYRKTSNYQLVLSKLQNHLLECQKELKRNKKLLLNYQNILDKLNRNERFTEIENYWKVFSFEIQKELILKVFEEQKKLYNELLEEKNSLKHSDIYELLMELNVHPIFIDYIERLNLDKENLSEILNIIKQNNFPISKITDKKCLTTLLSSDKKNIISLISYFKTSAIDIEFLIKHPQILIDKSDKKPYGLSEIANNNFKLLKDNQAQFNSEYYNPNILLLDSNELYKRIKLAENYNLNLKNNEEVFNLINEPSLFDLLDFAIENGLPIDQIIKIKANNEEINNIIKRLLIYEEFGYDIIVDSKINYNIINGNSFFVPNEMLDELIENSTQYEINNEMEEILKNNERLELYQVDDNVKLLDELFLDEEIGNYNFYGVIISRNKVLRNLYVLKKYFNDYDENYLIYQSIIFNEILKTEELDLIKNCYKQYTKKLI